MNPILVLFFRWLHIIPATLVIGGIFFMRIVLPVGLAQLEPEQAKAVFLRCRRVFKFVVHASILCFLISGVYNSMANWPKYANTKPLSHALFGTHVLLALFVFTISLVLLAGKEPPKPHRQWMMVNLVLLLVLVAVASGLKSVRDRSSSRAGEPAAVHP